MLQWLNLFDRLKRSRCVRLSPLERWPRC